GTSALHPGIAQVNPRRLSSELVQENLTAHNTVVNNASSAVSRTPQSGHNVQMADSSIALLADTPNNVGAHTSPGSPYAAVNTNDDTQQHNPVQQANASIKRFT
ncbi:unnamed protein product, partial [Ectocarpus sp. 4 AP-2014]